MHVRQRDCHHVQVDRPKTFKATLDDAARDAFRRDRRLIWNRRDDYFPEVARSMAVSYKLGVDMFPSHFEFAGRSYSIEEPLVLAHAKKTSKKKVAFLEGIFQGWVAEGLRDRCALLFIGLATAQKVPHWVGFAEEGHTDDAFSETDLEDDE